MRRVLISDLRSFDYQHNRTLPGAYQAGRIPSTSYGLQIGSVYPNVSGSLTLGGYDASRCITEPLISDSQSVNLVGISLNVSSGGFAYEDASSVPILDLLRANGSVAQIEVTPDPGVRYLSILTTGYVRRYCCPSPSQLQLRV